MSAEPSTPLCVLTRDWPHPHRELSFVVRSVAGAATRSRPVRVLAPGPPGVSVADGAFDVMGLGADQGRWPPPDGGLESSEVPDRAPILFDDAPDLVSWLADRPGTHPLFTVSGSGHDGAAHLSVVPPGGEDSRFIGLHVPVNPLAAAHRHNGFGQVGYVLVLSDDSGRDDQPVDAVAWVTAGFYDIDVVVVERATASLWRGRARRGTTSVDSRTDLWRLMAHARVCVDTSPGSTVARECVESMRFGTPIIVPRHSVAARHVEAGTGLAYASLPELVDCVGRCRDDAFHKELSIGAKEYADATYGDPAAFCDRVSRALVA
jgi:hypothetical protein